MKFQAKKVTITEGPELDLRLVKVNGGINVVATNKNGLEQTLVGFSEEGRLILYGCIDETMCFDLTDSGELKTRETR